MNRFKEKFNIFDFGPKKCIIFPVLGIINIFLDIWTAFTVMCLLNFIESSDIVKGPQIV